ncbi:MAG: MBL fold metallo-hydrolase, partial [Clostridia bacterium]
MGNKSKMYVKLESSNDEVTGSCFRLLATLPNKKEINFLVECGKFQGNNQEKFNEKLPFEPRNYDFVILTHNHMDHMGRLPQLFNKGYNKKVYTTTLNKYLLKPALDDAYKVEENNAKHLKNGMTFTTSDITSVIENTKGCKYMKAYQPHKNVNVIFYENGHLPGSAYISVEIFFEGYKSIFLLFSGDYKKYNMLYLTDNIPEEIKDIPFTIIQESTYGKSDSFEKKSCIKRNIIDTIKNGGSVVIPSFAQGRYDEIAYILKCMQDDNLLDKSIPIGFDGKLPKRYWYIRKKHLELYHYICDDILPSNIVEISKENRESFIHSSGSKIIVTTSGMATYGPAPMYIKHFLKQKN